MRTNFLTGIVLALALPAAAAAIQNITSVMINKDLVNQGPAAYDLAIVLEGDHPVFQTVDGYQDPTKGPIGWFDPPTRSVIGSNFLIHWQNFFDGNDSKIDTNQKIHVGFAVAPDEEKRNILDMYWTDLNGHRIAGSIVYNIKDGITYQGNRWNWTLSNVQAEAISVRAIHYAILSDPLSLDQLSTQNTQLAAALQPLSEDLVVGAGGSVSIPLPDIPTGGSVVVVYEETAEGSAAVVTNFAQAVIGDTGAPGN